MANLVPVLVVEHVDYDIHEIAEIDGYDEFECSNIWDMLVADAKEGKDYWEWENAKATVSESPIEGKVIRVTLAKVEMLEPLE